MIFLPYFALSVTLGFGLAFGTHYLMMNVVPAAILIGLTAFAAMLPGLLIFALRVTRPLAQLTTAVEISVEKEDFKSFAAETGGIPSTHCQRIRDAVIALQKKTTSVAREMAERGSQIAIASAQVSFSADELRRKMNEQVQHANSIGTTSQEIKATTRSMSQAADHARDSAYATRDASSQGETAVSGAIERIHHVRAETERSAQSLGQLQARSEEIQTITRLIDGVAEQTNMLALNAAIEAARAGEHGRGFAVVADEVRQLASKTTEATREIGEKLASIHQEVNESVSTMQNLAQVVESVVTDTEGVGSVLQGINGYSEESANDIGMIATTVEEHVNGVGEISESLSQMEVALTQTENEVQLVSEHALALSDTAETVYKAIAHYELDTVHDRVRHIALHAVAKIVDTFESAISSGRISLADLMDRDYKEAPNTDPVKYHTRFDRFTDEVLPAIQEPILQENTFILYAGAVDNNGYFPTHNKRYSKPLTGNYETDLANNRTKRLFSDRTGSRCGKNTEPFLLQTYKRDTGEIMHDMSVPIFLQGRHWGGFRIGYKASDTH